MSSNALDSHCQGLSMQQRTYFPSEQTSDTASYLFSGTKPKGRGQSKKCRILEVRGVLLCLRASILQEYVR